MEIPDLSFFPSGHPPSPYGFPIGFSLPQECNLIAVGWLERSIPNIGEIPGNCISRLIEAYENKLVIGDLTMGIHQCTFCSASKNFQPNGRPAPNVVWKSKKLWVRGYGHFLVRHGNEVFMAPQLIIHYIAAHSYRPPNQFIDAVANGKFLKLSDLERESKFMLDPEP